MKTQKQNKLNKKPKSQSQRCLLTQAFLNLWRSLSSLFPSPTRKLKSSRSRGQRQQTQIIQIIGNLRKEIEIIRLLQTTPPRDPQSPSPVTRHCSSLRIQAADPSTRHAITFPPFFLSNQLPRRLVLIYFIC